MSRFEKTIVAIMAYCKKHGVTAHTTRTNPLEFRKRVRL